MAVGIPCGAACPPPSPQLSADGSRIARKGSSHALGMRLRFAVLVPNLREAAPSEPCGSHESVGVIDEPVQFTRISGRPRRS